ncbi:retrovirus-related pol polyprotein from transposon TNT 1-94 [Tanacetum coccineum]
MLTKPQAFYDNIHKQALGYQNLFHLKKAQRIKPTLYDGIVISDKHVAMPVIDDEETLILEEESGSKIKPSDASPVKIDAPKELPKLQDKDTTTCKLKDIIKSMREKYKDENVNYDYCEIETKNVELENSVAKLISENECLCNEINHVKQDLKAEIQDKVFVITSLKNDLRKVKGKEIVDIAAQIPSAITIVPGMFKPDLEPLAPRLLKNREAHLNYLKFTQEQDDILQGIVEQAKAKQPLDKELDFACKHAQRIQELLVYVRDTCPNAINLSAKKVAVTPKNKVKKVRFVEPLTSSSNIKQVESSTTSDSNTPVLSPTGLKCSTSNCGSKPTSNKKNDRISRTPSRNMKNKKSMFDGVHDMCLLNFVENVNSRAKSAKKHKKQNIWKPTGHVFIEVGLKWKPTGRTFTIVGCPDCSLVSGLRVFETYDRKPLSAHELCVDLLSRSRNTNLYTISLDDILKTSLICLLSKASKTKSWLWHHCLSHLNFGTLNKLAKDGLARGIPRLKFQKDHLCSACALGKSKKSSHQPKAKDTNQEKLYLLHMDLCGPMRVVSINRKRYILVIVDDYSRFTWVRFLRTKDEAPKAIIK